MAQVAPTGVAGEPAPPVMNVVRCPHLPGDGQEIPQCGGQAATCVGTEGPDLIIGSDEKDVIVAGAGDDIVLGNAGRDTICGGAGNDSLMGSSGKDVMYGEEGNDWLFGAQGPDVLNGGPGDFDVLWGGPGIDRLDGGLGDHDVCLHQKDMGQTDMTGCNTVYPLPGYQSEDDVKAGVIAGASGGSSANRPAATVIKCPWIPEGLTEIPTCGGKPATCVGTEGNDLLYGTAGADVIWGGAGDDVLHGDDGNDILCGGPGTDALMGAGGNDSLYGDEGDDWLFGAKGDDILYGGEGDADLLWGGPGRDKLYGGFGATDVCLLEGCKRSKKVLGFADESTCETIFASGMARGSREPEPPQTAASEQPITPSGRLTER